MVAPTFSIAVCLSNSNLSNSESRHPWGAGFCCILQNSVNGAAAQDEITLIEPQRAMTPGQAVVLYDGDRVVGGGTITDILHT